MKNTYTYILGLCCLGLTVAAGATDYYVTETGSGAKTGTSWADAFDKSVLNTTGDVLLNTTMVAGDTLYVGSGNYGAYALSLTSSGSAGLPKSIIGVDTGTGLPVFNSNNWSRTNPTAGQGSIIGIGTGASYWTVANLNLRNCVIAVTASTTGTTRTGLTFRNVDIQYVRHGFYVSNCDDLLIEDCSVTLYSKHAYRLELGCDNVAFNNCVADLSLGDASWYDYSEPFVYGFIVNNGGAANTNIAFTDCLAQNNLQNGQSATGFWNGDGFDSENNTVGISYTRCIAINNEDGGFDCKQAAGSNMTFTDCVSVGNANNYKVWASTVDFNNCVSSFQRPRGGSGTSNDVNGIRIENATTTVRYCSFLGSTGAEYNIAEKGASGTATVYDSILAFNTASGGGQKSGTVTLDASTVSYRPGSGVDPAFVNPVSTWDGLGTDMDSVTYGLTKGYNSEAVTGGIISMNLADPSGANTLVATDVVGVLKAANWNNTAAASQSFSNVKDDSGTATTADIVFSNTTYGYVNDTPALAAPLDDDAKMMRSQRGLSNGSSTTTTVTQVPYAKYDVYVYWGGRTAIEAVPITMTVQFQTNNGSGYTTFGTGYIKDSDHLWDGTYNESTATTSTAAVDGNEYVVFRNVTDPSFKIISTCGVRTGISGFQVVERP